MINNYRSICITINTKQVCYLKKKIIKELENVTNQTSNFFIVRNNARNENKQKLKQGVFFLQ